MFSLVLLVFWLLFAYYVTIVLFSLLSRSLPAAPSLPPENCPPVAILYPTYNDFQVEAADSCLKQDYPGVHLFLLDDSTRDVYRARIDAYQAALPERITVVRRPSRRGFKPGNLNHALREAAAHFPFFAVVDADERLPEDFLKRTMAHLHDSQLAFVQANHAPNPLQTSSFARDMAPTILPFWYVHCPPRNRFGFVLFLGHGAVVRRSAWEAVGGFPEVVTEDLAFSALLGTQGLRGAFLDDLVCYEDFATTYRAFKRQYTRYVIGTTQVLCTYVGSLLRSPRLSLSEKIDFCLSCLPLYVPALNLMFAALCGLGLAGILGSWGTLTISILGHDYAMPAVRILDASFEPLWTYDFQLFSVLNAFSPALACVVLGLRRKLRALRLLSLSTVPYLSVMLVSWGGILSYLLLGKSFFVPTGGLLISPKEQGTLGSLEPSGIEAAHRTLFQHAPRLVEITVGGVLVVASLLSMNIGLLALCCSLLVGVYIEAYGWEGRYVRIACIGCFALILLYMLFSIVLLLQGPGLAPLVFSVHF